MDENKEKSIYNKHDKGYKFLLSSKRVLLQLLRSFVNQGWVEKIDEKNMVRIDKSFVLQDFNDRESDLVYRIKIKDQEVLFYILMEFQSSVDFQMPYRLLLYMIEIWRSILKDVPNNEAEKKGFKLPAIVPIVLYNGEYNWTASRTFKETLSGYDMFEDFILDFKYILIDVNRYSEEELLNLSNLIGAVFLLDQKVDTVDIIERLNKLINTLKGLGTEEFLLFRNWVKNIIVKGLPEDKKEEISMMIEENEEVEAMIYNLEKTLKEEFKKREEIGKIEGIREGKMEGIREGKVEGIKQGKMEGKIEGKIESKMEVARRMLKKGMEIILISEVTDLTIEEVEKIKKEDLQ